MSVSHNTANALDSNGSATELSGAQLAAVDALADRILTLAKAKGADGAEVLALSNRSVSASCRLGKPETLTGSETHEIGMRVFISKGEGGMAQAIVSTSSLDLGEAETLVERAIAMARAVPSDPYAGLAVPAQLATSIADLDLYDSTPITPSELAELAMRAEASALAINGITNSEGADASAEVSRLLLKTSTGFQHSFLSSDFGFSVSVLAAEGTSMERDYDYTMAAFFKDLEQPEAIGERAARQALKRLNPKKVKTCTVPVVYDPRVSKSLLSHLAGAINGATIARGTSFLKDKMGQKILSDSITVVDDPHCPRSPRARGFDCEGLPTQKRTIVENGVLQSWILDLASSRKLGLESTGHAARSVDSPPHPSVSTFLIQNGSLSPADLISDIKSGFYVTELMGSSVSLLTGDYSRGASGFWIENGVISYAVSEVTIAGTLQDIFLSLVPANDLKLRTGIDAPTLRTGSMTVAGS